MLRSSGLSFVPTLRFGTFAQISQGLKLMLLGGGLLFVHFPQVLTLVNLGSLRSPSQGSSCILKEDSKHFSFVPTLRFGTL